MKALGEARGLRWLGMAVVGLLSAAFTAGMFLPVYSDEIGWRFQERAGFDGVDKMFSEVCGPNTLAVPPWFMWPVRWYSAFFNGAFADPFWIRVSGVLYALLWVALAMLLIRRITQDRVHRWVIATIGLGLLALGTTPLLLVWSRPEQPIALAALAALLVAFADSPAEPRPTSTTRQAWMRSLAIFALSCVAISYHLKGLFLLPLMLAALFFASRGPKARAPRIVAGLLALWTTALAVFYWRDRLDCPENAFLSWAYNLNNLSGRLAEVSSLQEARALFGKLIQNISVFEYVTNIGPQVRPLSFWLEHGQVGQQAAFQWFLAISVAWATALAAGAAALVVSVRCDVRDRRLDPRPILAVIVFGVAIAWSATQSIRNVYESKFVLLLLVLAILLALSRGVASRLKPWLNTVAVIVGLFALVSPFAIGAIYAPSLARAASQQGMIEKQRYSVSVFGFSKLKPDIAAAAKLCGIVDPAKANAVMIDDVTYFSFIQSHLPQHQLGVIGGWNGKIKDPFAYLDSRGSQGAVVSCRILDDGQRGRAKRAGDFCCLGPPNW